LAAAILNFMSTGHFPDVYHRESDSPNFSEKIMYYSISHHQCAHGITFPHGLLPINYRIDYKVATLAYKIRSTGSPAYLLSSVSDYMPTRHLRSSTQLLLVKPPVKTEIARRSFSQAAPAVWNSLPHAIRSAETYGRFRSALRTHYYRLAFID
jgi:hypothetical protein